MNFAYLSRLCLTSSAKRTCRVVVFGCFDGAFSSAKCFSSFRYSRSHYIPHYNLHSFESCRQLKHGHAVCVTITCITGEEKWQNAKCNEQFLPFFTCFHLLGWSDRHGSRGNEVGSLQPNSVPFRGHLDHFVVRNFFAFGHMLDRAGEREGDA